MFSTYQALCLSHFIVFSLILWVQLYFREGRWSLEKLKECPNHKAFKLPRPDSNEVKVLVTQSCLTLGDPMDCSLPGSSVHGDSPGKNAGLGCHAVLQGIFPLQGLNPGLLHCKQILYHLSQQESLGILEWVAYPFSRGPSWPRNRTRVSCIAGRFIISCSNQ